jgi:predicted nucleic-acid-binding Zn-ribbon protein
MGADNWAMCPKCGTTQDQRVAAVEEQYGKVPLARFRELMERAKSRDAQTAGEESLREDYELGIGRTGLFFVRYQASCKNCGFAFEYDHEQPALPR